MHRVCQMPISVMQNPEHSFEQSCSISNPKEILFIRCDNTLSIQMTVEKGENRTNFKLRRKTKDIQGNFFISKIGVAVV